MRYLEPVLLFIVAAATGILEVPKPVVMLQCKCGKWTNLADDDIRYCAYCGNRLWTIEISIHEDWCIGGEKGPCNCGAKERQP